MDGEPSYVGGLTSGRNREGRASGRAYNAPNFQGFGGAKRPEMAGSCAAPMVYPLLPELLPPSLATTRMRSDMTGGLLGAPRKHPE